MRLKKKSIKINTLQKDISGVTEEIKNNPNTFFEIQRYKDNIGYIISPNLAYTLFDYLEELEMLNDKELIQSIKESKAEHARGEGQTLEEVLKEIENE